MRRCQVLCQPGALAFLPLRGRCLTRSWHQRSLAKYK